MTSRTLQIRRSLRLVALILAAVALRPAVAAAEPPSVTVIFDGSGSMWGKIDGDRRSRLVVARDALRQALAKAPAETQIGLVSFGHRRGGDCDDVELLLAPEAAAADKIGNALEKLNPRGKGPIAAALREAAGALTPSPSQSQSLILIHDDADNCRDDPCAAAGEIRKSHPRLKVHVVSLAMRKDEMAKMACVATQTGGRQFDASSAAQLTAAIDEVFRITTREATKPAAPAPAKSDAAAPAPQAKTLPSRKREGPPGLMLAATLTQGGAPLDMPMRWRIARRGEDKALTESEQPAPSVALAPGSYVVSLTVGAIRREATFEVAAAGPTEATIVLDGGLAAFAPDQAAGADLPGNALYTVLAGDGGALLITRETTAALPAGDYVLLAEDGIARWRKPFAVKAGSVTRLDAGLAVGRLRLALALREGAPPVESAHFIIYEDDPDAPQGRREVMRTAAPQPELTLAVGTYYVIARHGGAEARERIALRPGEAIERTLVAPGGRLSLTTRLAGVDAAAGLASYRIERLDLPGAEPLIVSRPAPQLDLAAGRYRIESRLGSLNARLQREVEVKAGTSQTVVLDHKAALLHLRLLDPASGLAIADAFWEIRSDTGQLVWATSQAEPRAPVLAGRYVVRAEQRGRIGERAIELKAGEQRTFEISFK